MGAPASEPTTLAAPAWPQEQTRVPPLALALLLGLSIGWGANWPVLKIGLAEIPPWTFRGGSTLIAGLTLLGLARLTFGSTAPPARVEWRGLALTTLFNVTLWNILSAYGVALVPSGQAALLAYTMPLWVVLFSRLILGEPITGRSAAAVTLGFAGIVVLLENDLATLGGRPVGAALCLGAAIAWAIGTLLQKHHRTALPTLTFTGYQLVLGSLPMLAVVPFVEGVRLPHASAAAWLSAASNTFIALAFCYFAWFEIVRLLPARVASTSVLLVPVIGVLSGTLLLGEPFGGRELLAIALIGSALALTLLVPTRNVPERWEST